jgi:dihydrofolate synthase/folylpolyglutamate synthase
VTQSQSERAVPAEELVEIVREFTDETTDFDSFGEAVQQARTWAAESPGRAVVVTGSITLVGEAIALAAAEGWKR